MNNQISVGSYVNYHSIINRPATSFNHKVLKLGLDESGEAVAWVKGIAGYVSLDALSLAETLEPAYEANKLTPAIFDDLKKRMINDCRGELVKDHGTADAMFFVEEHRRITGIDLAFCDASETIVQFGQDAEYIPFDNLIESLEEDELNDFEAFISSQYEGGWTASDFHEMHSIEDTLYAYGQHADINIVVTGFRDEWKFLNAHFTNDSANHYIQTHGHKHEGELRVSVESMYRCNELNLVRNAIMNGELVLKG